MIYYNMANTMEIKKNDINIVTVLEGKIGGNEDEKINELQIEEKNDVSEFDFNTRRMSIQLGQNIANLKTENKTIINKLQNDIDIILFTMNDKFDKIIESLSKFDKKLNVICEDLEELKKKKETATKIKK